MSAGTLAVKASRPAKGGVRLRECAELDPPSDRSTIDQKCLPSWRNPARYPTSHDADVFVHASHLMGGVHQRGGRRAAYRAAHRGAVGPERSGRSILKITSLCRCAGPQEAAFCVLRAMRHRGCYGIGGRVFEHRVIHPVPARAARDARAIYVATTRDTTHTRRTLLECFTDHS